MEVMTARCVEMKLEPGTPWRSSMTFASDRCEFTVPYDEKYKLGDIVNIEITPVTEPNDA